MKRDGGGVADSPLSPQERTLFSDTKRMRREEKTPSTKTGVCGPVAMELCSKTSGLSFKIY